MRWTITGALCLVLVGCAQPLIGSLSGQEVTPREWNQEHRRRYHLNHLSDPVKFKMAIRAGRLEIGMNKTQVRAALNLDPYGRGYAYRTYRSVDAGGTFEAWEVHTYRDMGLTRASHLPHFETFTAYFRNDELTSWVE